MHEGWDDRVAIGYLPPELGVQAGYFRTELFVWWERMFQKMRQPGHRFNYTDLLSGNFSIKTELFHQAGCFDANFICHEDYEFGVRLIKLDARLIFTPEALGYHYETTDLKKALDRKLEEGKADVALGEKYPELIESLLMTRLESYARIPSRIMRTLAFSTPRLGDFLARMLERILSILERVRAFRMWQRVLDGLMGYWYWRGVTYAFDSVPDWRRFKNRLTANAKKITQEFNCD